MGLSLRNIYADQFGWEEVAPPRKIYNSLPPELRAKREYSETITARRRHRFFGPRYGLLKPSAAIKAIGLGPAYYTRRKSDRTRRTIALRSNQNAQVFKNLTGHLNPYAVEQGPIFICNGLKWNLQEVWPELKKWR